MGIFPASLFVVERGTGNCGLCITDAFKKYKKGLVIG
jgi:hypothetical protein